jgi:hypothetical protein
MKCTGWFRFVRAFLVVAGLVGFAAPVLAVGPVVSNVRASQRAGTGVVDVYYDLASASNALTVTVTISTNGGAAFNAPGDEAANLHSSLDEAQLIVLPEQHLRRSISTDRRFSLRFGLNDTLDKPFTRSGLRGPPPRPETSGRHTLFPR